jgi:Outer membrane protein beta-barrel domain
MNSVGSHAGRSVAVLAIAVWLIGLPAAARAQSAGGASVKPVSGLGYGFVGAGAASGEGESTGTWHFGGGGEAVFGDAVGVGAEIGYLSAFESGSEGIGVFSLNGSYHFGSGPHSRKLRPFVTGGYTLGFRDGYANLFNVGGGVQYWLKPKVGLRFEVRDHIWSNGGDTIQFWGVRVGVTFR